MLAKLQAKYRKAHERLLSYQYELQRQYGETWRAPAGKQRRYEALREVEQSASGAIFDWLREYSPREWSCGVPSHWICTELTEADALTSGELSVIPPVAYGATPAYVRSLAGAV